MKRKPTFLKAISTIIVMVIAATVGFVRFNIPIQILLLIASTCAAFTAMRIGSKWKDLEEGITRRSTTAMPAIFIILTVGIIASSWMYAGTVPTLVYYGFKFLDPSYSLIPAFIISAICSLATGTAWGSAPTAGIALVPIGSQLGINQGMAANVIIVGAVFGDKMSLLSDITNLAAFITKVSIFSHTRVMMWTTISASIIGLIVWFFAELNFQGNVNTKQIKELLNELASVYNINFFVWVLLIAIIICLILKISTVPSTLVSALNAILIDKFNNGFKFVDGFRATFDGSTSSMTGHSHVTENAKTLIEQGGMMSMTQITVIIFCGCAFAGIVEKSGCLDVMLQTVAKGVKSVGTLVLITVLSSLMLVFAAGVTSIVIIMVGVPMKGMFEDMNLDRSNLPYALEDSNTMVLPLIPWGTSGAYYAQQLGVSVDQFFIWAVPYYLCAMLAITYGFTDIGVRKKIN